MIYIFILLGKILEVTLMTLRMVLVTRGEKKLGATIAFFEVIIWLVVVANVLDGITEDPLKAVVYSLGFALGNWSGMILEERLAIGTSQVQIIARTTHSAAIRERLYAEGYACTAVDGQGKKLSRQLLYVIAPRKKVKDVIAIAKNEQEDAFVTVQDVKPYHGGFGWKLRK